MMRRGGTSKGALAALGLAGLVWAYKNRDKLGAKLNEIRNQLPSESSYPEQTDNRSFESQTDVPGTTRLGDNYNTTI